MTLKELREKLAARQDTLAKVFAEAKTDAGDFDFEKVACLGAEVKGSIAVAEKVREMNDELNEIGVEIEALDAAEKAAHEQASREKVRSRPPHAAPEGKGNYSSAAKRVKSLGEMVVEEKNFQAWQKAGVAGGVTVRLDDFLPSDILARAHNFPTVGMKADFSTTAGWAPESVRIPGLVVEGVTRPLQIVDIVPLGRTGMEQIVYMEETTRTHAAAEKAEGVASPESTFALTEKTSSVRKITDSIPVTDEQLEDVAQAESYLNGRLAFGLRQRLDLQILVGNGTAPNLRGIKNTSGIQTQAKGTDPIPDAFFKAMRKIRVTGRAMPTHILMHPEDWEKVRLLRTADGVYIWGNPSEAGPERMWGLPVIQQDADVQGTGYVGSFQPAWIQAFERRGVDVQVGYVGTQFTEGKRTIRADTRWAVVVFRPAAFASVTGL
jgi:HK97 family phage major capsid protein